MKGKKAILGSYAKKNNWDQIGKIIEIDGDIYSGI